MTAINTQAAPGTTATTRRAANIALWAAQIFIAAFLLFASAAPKFAGQQDAVETFTKIGWGQWFRYVTGTVELVGAIGLLIPRLAGLAALGLIGLMAGAVLTQLFVLEPVWALLPIAYGVILALVARARLPQLTARTGRH
ncbi:DoxX family protein [Actinomadura sp. HBU206391]|uniref:DoxX family protein n=1 Tax=Actinomadura sp. HBU206391 TaxID=2731692 RepID=UPI00164F8C59|nr:DoxX family protein [Actinomadura sp. HBU206391]MBC6457028.1 DoxX family protein [Actinomadura sp. HBU206391]